MMQQGNLSRAVQESVLGNSSTAMRLAHLMTGEKYSDKQMEHTFQQAKGVVCGEDTIHPDKTTASNLLEILDAMSNHIYLALVHEPKSELIWVKKLRVCNKKLQKETKQRDQNFTLLTKLKGRKKPSTKHAPCTASVTDEDLVKSFTTLDDSEAMLLFVAWGSDEDLRYIAMFPEVISVDTTYGTNREKRQLLLFAGTDFNRKKITALWAFLQKMNRSSAIPALIGTYTVERINQINTDGDRQIYTPSPTVYKIKIVHGLVVYTFYVFTIWLINYLPPR
jgi:hypothetical protein